MLLNDEPTTEDRLGRGALADELADLIATCKPPYVLGIDGDWGAGKTSFLKLLEQRLPQQQRRCKVVFFEAWRHQFEAQPAVALLHAIRDQFSLSRKVWNEAGKLGEVTAYTGLRLLDDLAGSLVSLGAKKTSIVETARAEGERLEQARWSVPLTSEAFRSAFEQAIRALTGPDFSKLVVLIDDLDRCSDAAVVRLLEGLKLYLNADNCVFVIAADRRAVVRALQRSLFPTGPGVDLFRAELNAAEYSDKLFQSVRTLPLAADLGPLLQACWPDGDGEGLAVARLQAELGFLPPNPRKAKRFAVELHGRLHSYRELTGHDPDLSLACAVQALQTFHPSVYRVLEGDPDFWEQVVVFAEEGPVLEQRHGVFEGLTVPDRVAEERSKGASGLTSKVVTEHRSITAPTFHDPGDISVFRAARIVRQHRYAPKAELYRLVRGSEPQAGQAEEAPALVPEAADLGEETRS